MEFQHPEALYLILPLCVAWIVLSIYSEHQRRRARRSFAAAAMWSRIFPRESSLRFWLKLALREFAMVMSLVALAGPRFGVQFEQIVPRGADLYVLIDVSRSMLAEDVPPSRLGRAKADVSSLLNRLQGERVGLIAFAGQAVVKCPLTVDYDSFRRALEELDPDSAPRGGTAIGDAIRKGLEVFHANAERDQAMLLITDGDDQQSYPLEAAAVANERHVTIFTIGLGDSERGARVPRKGDSKSFVEYQGEQIWSKLDSNLLEQIALKTSGICIPAGTRAYDLGELYTNHLQGRKGNEAASQQRIRRSERFQIFLALAIAALLIDLMVSQFQRSSDHPRVHPEQAESTAGRRPRSRRPGDTSNVIVSSLAVLAIFWSATPIHADEPTANVREGLQLYSKDQFEEAREKFSSASEELEKRKSAAAAIAEFDEACAAHRKGDFERARERYLRAGLSQDRSISTAAHFNLGMISAERARSLCGDKPEQVPPDKRPEILEQLTQAVTAYRHCLELQSDHLPARRNLELVRKWIKYYSDRWRELDRQKRRDESNLLSFVEYLIQAQTALRETVKQIPEPVHSDTFAELKRAQGELREEIPTLRDKIDRELRPQPDPQSTVAAPANEELEQGIKLLQSWADTAGEKMNAAAQRLATKDAAKAINDQQTAIDELDKIWEGIVPFHPLLAKELKDQTAIASILTPHPDLPTKDKSEDDWDTTEETKQDDAGKPAPSSSERMELADDDLPKLEELQSQTLKKSRLIAPKAEMELERLEHAPAPNSANQDDKSKQDSAAPPTSAADPEQAKAGYRKAMELAPEAVEKMEAAMKSLKHKDRATSAKHAEKARKILEEIQQAQPKNEQKQDQKDQDQKDKDQQQQNKQGDDQKQDEKKQDEKKPDEQKLEKNGRDQESQSDQKQSQVPKDRIEDALRKVRERQQEKRERDRKLKGLYLGKTPVDKDW